jgi:hypothetical protein
MRHLAQARNPYSLSWSWIPGSRKSAPRNDGLISIRDTSAICSRCCVVICPSGGLWTGVSSPFCKNISVFIPPKSHLELFVSHPTTGAYRDRHGRGVRMRWTRQRFARDGIAGRVGERPVSDQRRADERCCSVRRSRVVLTPRRWRQVRGVKSARPGLDKTYPLMTVAKEPGHRGEREISRKTIACGNVG